MERLDKFLLASSMVESREKAKTEIVRGNVTVNGTTVTKPSYSVSDSDQISLRDSLKYVGKGGEKLREAITSFKIDLKGKTALDAGASTGGFTDCMLQYGAKKVYAVDVGTNQLHISLLNDERVTVMENTDIRELAGIDDDISFFTLDVSFISIRKVIGNLVRILGGDCEGIILLKPQFEVGRSHIGKNGVVRNREIHIRLLKDTVLYLQEISMKVSGLIFSPVTGKMGNIEYLIHVNDGERDFSDDEYENIVDSAFLLTKK